MVGNIVEEYKIGNTTIKIADDAYREKTPEDIDQILKRIMAIGIKIYETKNVRKKCKRGDEEDGE